ARVSHPKEDIMRMMSMKTVRIALLCLITGTVLAATVAPSGTAASAAAPKPSATAKPARAPAASASAFRFEEMTIAELQDGMKTAGSLALVWVRRREDSAVAARLRKAGAVILGKTNLSEWANIRSTHASSGWSGRGGQVRNPYALDRSPSGSSSGTGAAIAANFAAAGIGTETDGSIVSPSSANSLVGLKPTVGLVSRAGIVPISHHQDTAGPMCRTVGDAATLLGALTGVDPRDPATRESKGHALSDYTSFLEASGS